MPDHDLDPVRTQLAPHGVLRAALNVANFLLVSGQDAAGDWQGVAPDLAREVAQRLGVQVQFSPYRTPAELADAADSGDWCVAMIGADPARAERIAFTAPYVQIEASYLVPPDSALRHCADVDRPGHVVAAFGGSAYELWLRRNLQHARVATADSFEAAFNRFRNEGLTALACLKAGLLEDQKKWPGSRILEGSFMQVQQAVATPIAHVEAAAFLRSFVEDAKARGLVRTWIDRHKADALSVAPPAAQA